MRLEEQARKLWPFIQPLIEPMLRRGGTGSGGGGAVGGAPSPHAISDSTHHAGTIGDSQAPQFLKTDGTRQLVGNLAVGAGITVDGVDVSAHAGNASAHHAPVTVVAPVALSGQQVSLTLATDPALENSSGLRVKLPTPSGLSRASDGLSLADSVAGNGLQMASKILAVKPKTTSGLEVDSGGLALADSVAGAGLVIASKVLAVGAGNGVSVAADAVAVNLSYAFAWAANHTHAGNVTFTGAARTITSDGGNDLTLAAAGDLILDPTGNVEIPDAQEMRTTNFSDLVTGISGFRLWDRGSNYRQLTIGAMKMDELYARVFVADETRIDRGEEYWSKSYGIVETDFVMPADEVSVDVWFEDAPGLGTADLFSVGDWLLFRTVDWSTGIVIQKVWFEVMDAGTPDYVSKDATNKRQQWRIRRKVGGTTGQTIKKGSLALDTGQLGQGWVHLSALAQDGGPFLQMGAQTTAGTASAAPVFTNYVRMGNLNGIGGIATDTWGFAAAKDLAATIGSGFEGMVLDPTNGMRLYNTDLRLYSGSDLALWINRNSGINLLQDTSMYGSDDRYISWFSSLASLGTPVAYIGYYDVAGVESLILNAAPSTATLQIRMVDAAGVQGIYLSADQVRVDSGDMSVEAGDLSVNSALYGVRSENFEAYDAGGLYLLDDGGNVGLKVKDGGTLELSRVDSHLTVAAGYAIKHASWVERYVFSGTSRTAGQTLVRLSGGAYRAALVRITFMQRAGSGTTPYGVVSECFLLKQASGTAYASAVTNVSSSSRRIRVSADGANDRFNFIVTDTSDADVTVSTESTVLVEVTNASSDTAYLMTVTYAP